MLRRETAKLAIVRSAAPRSRDVSSNDSELSTAGHWPPHWARTSARELGYSWGTWRMTGSGMGARDVITFFGSSEGR